MKIPTRLLLFIFFILVIFIYSFRINTLLTFIGDQGWYYLSAYKLLTGAEFPLVGIASSHPWLHQGAFWTYLLSPFLFFGKLNVLSGFVLSLLFGIGTIASLLFVVRKMFSEKAAIISSILYAFSPLVIMMVRMPYHTTPISFLTIWYIYALNLITKKNKIGLPLSLFLLTTLYNFEIASALLFLPLISLLLIGIKRKELWVKPLKTVNTLRNSIVGFLVPLVPFLIYDLSHGFAQTFKFIAWVGYRILVVFGYPTLSKETHISLAGQISKEMGHLQRFLVIDSAQLSLFLFILFLGVFLYVFVKNKLYFKNQYLILSLWLGFSLVSYLGLRTSSDAYLPIFLPAIMIVIGVVLSMLKGLEGKAIYSTMVLILILNTFSLLRNDYFMNKKVDGNGPSYQVREQAVKKIILATKNDPFKLEGRGEGSKFASFTMNYEFISLSLGKKVAGKGRKFSITENYDTVSVMEVR